MKTTMRIGLLLGVLALLGVAQPASAYYDPSVQRWINRDPIEESGGVNLYVFVDNTATSEFDPWGYYKLDGRKITVEGCEIVIVYGHGSKGKPYQFDFPAGGRSGGAAVTCWNRETNCRIPEPNRVPNAPDDPGLILWRAPIATDRNRLEAEESGLPVGNEELAEVIKGAQQKAEELTKSGKCKRVTIRFIRIPDRIFPDRAVPPCPTDIVVTAPRKPNPNPKSPNPKPGPRTKSPRRN